VGRYLAAIVEQGLWSLLNLGVNLGVARFVAPDQYGAFVFWTNCGFVLVSLQNALTVCHIQVLAPGAGTDPHRLETERLMHAVTILFLLVVGGGASVGVAVSGGAFAMPAAILFLPAFVLQQYLRALNFSRGKAGAALAQTAWVLLLAAGLLGAAMAAHMRLQANIVLLGLGAAYGLVGLGGAAIACGPQLANPRRLDLRPYGAFALQSGWVFLGVSTTELLARFYAFIVAAWYGPTPLAILAATNLLLRPIPLLASSWSMVARVDLARQREARRWGAFTAMILAALAGGAIVALIWTAAVGFSWPALSRHVFGGKYGGFAWMVGLWGIGAALNFGQVVLSSGLQVLKAFKVLALANAAASVTAAVAIVLIMARFGYAGAIVGTAAGQFLELAVMALLLAAALKRPGAPAGR
jgi:O-antigen/teichoic acid export membrane protein